MTPPNPRVAAFLASAQIQLEEADEQVDLLRNRADLTIDEVASQLASVRSLYAARAVEDLIGAIANLAGVSIRDAVAAERAKAPVDSADAEPEVVDVEDVIGS